MRPFFKEETESVSVRVTWGRGARGGGGQREPSQRCPLVPAAVGSPGPSSSPLPPPLNPSGFCSCHGAPRFPLIGPRLPLEFLPRVWASGMSHPDLRPLLGGPGLARPGEKRRHPLPRVLDMCVSLTYMWCAPHMHTHPHACTYDYSHVQCPYTDPGVLTLLAHLQACTHARSHSLSPLPAPLLAPLPAVSTPRD